MRLPAVRLRSSPRLLLHDVDPQRLSPKALISPTTRHDGANVLWALLQSIGGFWRLGVEVGPLSAFSAGIVQDVRYFPRFYHDHCATFRHYTAFIRLRLAPLGGRR